MNLLDREYENKEVLDKRKTAVTEMYLTRKYRA